MGATSDIDTYSDRRKEQKGKSSVGDPMAIKRQKTREYQRHSRDGEDAYCGVVNGVDELPDEKPGSFLNPMIATEEKVEEYIDNNTNKWESGLIVYFSSRALNPAQKNLRKKLADIREKKFDYEMKAKAALRQKFLKKKRHTCKVCTASFPSSSNYFSINNMRCPCCKSPLMKLVIPMRFDKKIVQYKTSYITKTTERHLKRKRDWDANTNPKKKPFQATESGYLVGGIAAC